MVWWRTIYHSQSVQHEWWYSRREKKTVWHQQKKFEKLIQLAVYTWVFACLRVYCRAIETGEMSSVRSQFVLLNPADVDSSLKCQNSKLIHTLFGFLPRNFNFRTKILLKRNENYGLIISFVGQKIWCHVFEWLFLSDRFSHKRISIGLKSFMFSENRPLGWHQKWIYWKEQTLPSGTVLAHSVVRPQIKTILRIIIAWI